MDEPIIEIIKSKPKKEGNMKPKHYHWTLREHLKDGEYDKETEYGYEDVSSGRIAIAYDEHWFKMDIVYGYAPPLQIIHDIVKSIDRPMLERIKEKNKKRKNPFRVHKRIGMSGCLDLQLFVLKDKELNIMEKAASLHISMYDKINQGIEMPTMDLMAIYEYEILPNLGRYSMKSLKADLEIILDEAETITFEDWHYEYNPQNNILTNLPKVLGKIDCTYLYLKKDKAGREYVTCDYNELKWKYYMTDDEEGKFSAITENMYDAILPYRTEIKELLQKNNMAFELVKEYPRKCFYKLLQNTEDHA
jgi:hypothetical protein